MSIARDLNKIIGRPPQTESRSDPRPVEPVVGSKSATQPDEPQLQRAYIGLLQPVTHGENRLGLPILHPEMRAYGETCINLGNRSGRVIVDVSIANSQEVTVVGNAAFEFSLGKWPTNSYGRNGDYPTGIDIPVVLLIHKNSGTTMTFGVSAWAPSGNAPVIAASTSGYFEIAFACRYYPGDSSMFVRGYPIIRPAS